MLIKKRNKYKKKKMTGRKEQGVVFHDKTKSEPFTVVLELSIEKKLFIFQLCDFATV